LTDRFSREIKMPETKPRRLPVSRYDWGQTNAGVEKIRDAVAAARAEATGHPVYERMHTLKDVTTFMEHHSFAV